MNEAKDAYVQAHETKLKELDGQMKVQMGEVDTETPGHEQIRKSIMEKYKFEVDQLL